MEKNTGRTPSTRRRRKSQWEIFREAYLPTIILGVSILLIIIFISGALFRSCDTSEPGPAESTPPASDESTADPHAAEAASLLAQAEKLAMDYEYQAAVDLLNTFNGNISDYPDLAARKESYSQTASQMVAWSDPAQIVNLSFHGLIADPTRAFSDEKYGKSYNRNFVTTEEFSQILQELYENDYVLVSLEDITSCVTDSSGHTTCEAKTIHLPLGKKPMLLTQTNLNYYTYMVDSNGDGTPDSGGDGFASRLMVDDSGKITCQMVDASGNAVTGSFDLVPILEDFIAEHPDFSYKGARAILAVSGYDGIFGYRTNSEVKQTKGMDYYNEQVSGATELVAALRQQGYELACYTYGNSAYGKIGASEIQTELKKWAAEVTPIFGETNILVFAQSSDIGTYSGSKFNVLQNAGFRYYLDFAEGRSGAQIGNNYISHQRLLVTGSQMAYYPTLFTGMFDAQAILDSQRGTVPK